jgi:hypothetical protein
MAHHYKQDQVIPYRGLQLDNQTIVVPNMRDLESGKSFDGVPVKDFEMGTVFDLLEDGAYKRFEVVNRENSIQGHLIVVVREVV